MIYLKTLDKTKDIKQEGWAAVLVNVEFEFHKDKGPRKIILSNCP